MSDVVLYKPAVEAMARLIDKIKGMCTSLMSLFDSIIDQRQEYIGYLIIHLMMVP